MVKNLVKVDVRHNIPSENDQCPCPLGLGYCRIDCKSKVSNIELETNSRKSKCYN